MITSNPIQTAIEAPSIEFAGVKIYGRRDLDRVIGRAVFPYETFGRSEVPINYHSVRTDDPAPSDTRRQERAAFRLRVVQAYHAALASGAFVKKLTAVDAIAKEFHVGPSSVQKWTRQFETQGESGLQDHYVKNPRKGGHMSAKDAADAVLVCAWWAFRIANVAQIGMKMMSAFVDRIVGSDDHDPVKAADLVATIDCYYSYDCDRDKYPFKSYARWLRHDLAKWMRRACHEYDYRRAVAADRKFRTPLQRSGTVLPTFAPDAKTRKRDTWDRQTTSAIARLADPPTEPSQPDDPAERHETIARARSASRVLGPEMTRRAIASTAPGPTPVAAIDQPQTMAESLAAMPDAYADMLFKAAGPDSSPDARPARDQAVATMALWWHLLPQTVRNNIDFRVDAWRRDHPHVTDRSVANRKMLMLLSDLRRKQTPSRLSVAGRVAR